MFYYRYTKTRPSISYAENIRKKETEKKKHSSRNKQETRLKKTLEDADDILEENNHEKFCDNRLKTEECCIIKHKAHSGFHQLSIPVVESPPKSPVISQSSFMHFEMQTPISKKNICSFLSDLESDFSSYSIANDEIDSFENETGVAYKCNENQKEKNQEILDSDEDSHSDSSTSDSSTSSSSMSSSSSSNSFDNSDESSNDGFSSGFGRFDSTTMQALNSSIHFTPIVSNIQIPSPFVVSATTSTAAKSTLFTPATCISHPMQFKAGANFPIPFKIYSLRDLQSNPISFPSTSYVAAPEESRHLVKGNIETKTEISQSKIEPKKGSKKVRSPLNTDRKHEVSHRKDEQRKSLLKQKSSSLSLRREKSHLSR